MSWQSADRVFIIMYRSERSGGTYTELRKTEEGRDRLLNTLKYLGYDLSQVIVTEQKKVWRPDLRKNGKRKAVTKENVKATNQEGQQGLLN